MSVAILGDSSSARAVITSMDEAALIREHDALIRALAWRFVSPVDDLVQIGRMALLEAARDWQQREKQTAQFWTYARKHVVGAMMDYVTRELARYSVEEASGVVPQPFVPPDVALEVKEHMEKLSPKEREVLEAHLAGSSPIEGVSNNAFHRTVEKIRKRA